MSQSATVHHRFHHNALIRKSLSVLYIILMVSYLGWRTTIFSPTDFTFSLLFYVAECFGFLLSLGYIISTWSIKHRQSKPVLDGRSVDIFIPAYQESAAVIRMTLIGALNIRYPHKTYLLDDGDRKELRDLANELGVHYICRPEHNHAKAGNINYALTQTDAEFFLVFDADHIAQPQAVEHMIGFFADPEIAMVQAPQDFYNTDSIEHQPVRKGKEIWHEQTLFYNTMLAGRDSHGALQGIGSGAFYRRSAIDDVGGIPTASVTEDIYTSLKLHQKGYRTAFFNEPIAYGLASTDLNDFYKTRHRWTHGNLQVLSYENFCIRKQLTLKQKLVYLVTIVAYLEGWQQAFLALIPIITIACGLRPFDITLVNIVVVLTIPFISLFLLSRLSGGYNRIFQNEILSLMRMPPHIISLPGIFRKKIRWNVSLKNIKGDFSYRLLWPQLTLLLISLATIVLGFQKMAVHNFHKGPLLEALAQFYHRGAEVIASGDISFSTESTLQTSFAGFSVDLFIVAGGWAAYNAFRCFCLIHRVKRCAENSNDFFRFPLQLPIQAKESPNHSACTKWISETHLSSDSSIGEKVTLTLPSGPLELNITEESSGIYQINWLNKLDRDILAKSLYSVDWHRELHHKEIARHGLLQSLLEILRIRPSAKVRDWSCAIENSSKSLALLEQEDKEIILFGSPPSIGDEVQLTINGTPKSVTLVSSLPLASLCSVNIDGTERFRFRYV